MKLIKSIGLGITIFLILNLIITIFSYFNLFNGKTIHVLKIITFVLTILISSFISGYKYRKKGLINGLKIGLIYIIISLFFIIIIPGLEFNIKLLLYYFLIILISIIGNIFGVNIKKTIK